MKNCLEKNALYLNMLNDIFGISGRLGIKSYIWGGFAVDILNGSLTREHGDLDCFCENLTDHIPELIEAYKERGYMVSYLDDFWMLQIKRDEVHAAFNHLKIIDEIAHWYHAGIHGTVFFPKYWLDSSPHHFYGACAYTAGVRFLYALKTRVELISPEWHKRAKDEADIHILREILQSEGIDKKEIYPNIWSHNPYWYAKGYKEYFKPILL